jgi:hypothetical protein
MRRLKMSNQLRPAEAGEPLYARVAVALRERLFELALEPGDPVEPERF